MVAHLTANEPNVTVVRVRFSLTPPILGIGVVVSMTVSDTVDLSSNLRFPANKFYLIRESFIRWRYSMEEIKRCPKCGREPKYYVLGPKQVIYCTHCDLKVEKMYATKDSLILDWNKKVS